MSATGDDIQTTRFLVDEVEYGKADAVRSLLDVQSTEVARLRKNGDIVGVTREQRPDVFDAFESLEYRVPQRGAPPDYLYDLGSVAAYRSAHPGRGRRASTAWRRTDGATSVAALAGPSGPSDELEGQNRNLEERLTELLGEHEKLKSENARLRALASDVLAATQRYLI